MLEQWLRHRSIHVRFYPSSALLSIVADKAIDAKNVQVNLAEVDADATTFTIQKVANDNFAIALAAAQGHHALETLMTFREEEDAKATLACIVRALSGCKRWYQWMASGFRFALTVLGTLALLLALLVVWKGYSNASALQAANMRTQADAQMAMQQSQAKNALEAQQLSQAKNNLGQAIGQPPPAEQAPAPQQPQAAPPVSSPGDAVARGLEGN